MATAQVNMGLGGYSFGRQRKLRTVLGKVASKIAGQKLVILGDSTNAGIGSTPYETPSYGAARYYTPAAVLARIIQKSGVECRDDSFIGGSGMETIEQYGLYNGFRVGYTAGWQLTVGNIAGGSLFGNSLTYGPDYYLVYTPEKSADRFDVYYHSAPGRGALIVSDTSGTLATISCDAAEAIRKATVSRASASLTPIHIYKDANGTNYLAGVDPWNSALPELRVLNLGVSGWRAGQCNDTSFSFSSKFGIDALEADYTYIEYGLNEKALGDTLAAFLANVTVTLDNALVGGRGAALGISAPAQVGAAHNLPPDWRQAIADLATARGIPCIDHYSVFESYEVSPGDYYDTVHLKPSGSGIKGRNLADWLLT